MGETTPVAAGAAAAELRGRYLDLVECALLNAIHGEPRLEASLRIAAMRLRHPWQTRAWSRRTSGRSRPTRCSARNGCTRLLLLVGVSGCSPDDGYIVAVLSNYDPPMAGQVAVGSGKY